MSTTTVKRLAWSAALACAAAGLAWAVQPRATPVMPNEPGTRLPPRPKRGRTVAAETDLQALLDSAEEGAVFCLSPGLYHGPLAIRRPVTFWGPRSAVLQTGGRGSTIEIRADKVRLLGFTIDGSGRRPDLMDAAVRVRGNDVRVEGLKIVHAYFGLVAEQSRRVSFVSNEIVGDGTTPPGLRGDAVRFWETRDSLIARNRISDSRDVVIWYSPGNRIVGNRVKNGRYGTHFMYSSDSAVRDNRYLNNIVGVFVMYSRNIQVRDNLMAGSTGADGMGLGAKESGNLNVTGNQFVKNASGIYLDTSPFRKGDDNSVSCNQFVMCDTGVVFHSSPSHNFFHENSFRDNQSQVRVEGRGNALQAEWRGNYFDDYEGYDWDGDGRGDVPYELRSYANQLAGAYPDLRFFRGTPAFELLDAAAHVFPLFPPKPLLVDPQPQLDHLERRRKDALHER